MVPPAPPARTYAGLVSRVAALAVDAVLLTVAGMAVSTLPGLAWEQIVGDPPRWLTVTSTAVAAVLPWSYFTGSWWLTGQTGGDLLFGLVVTSRDGRDVGFARAALRAAVGLTLAPVWLVGLLSVLWDPRRRAWHDRIFRTEVRYLPVGRAVAPSPR